MRVRFLYLAASLLGLAFAGPLPAQPATERVQPEVARLSLLIDGKPTEVVADIYKPTGAGPFPLVIFSHGRAGSRIERIRLRHPIAIGHGNYWLRKDRILLEGQSVGGMTTVATAALNLPGVVGAVNFSGGAGGNPHVSPGKSCMPDNLTETYRQFGQQARVPSLRLYAQNDQYWGPQMPTIWFQAYQAGGSLWLRFAATRQVRHQQSRGG